MADSSYRVLILGAGAGGISTAAKLQREIGGSQVAIVDPSEDHFYQPFWTLVGGGVVDKEESRRGQKDLIPSGVTWYREAVQSIDPVAQEVRLSHGVTLRYEFLIVATGLQLDWHKIQGLDDQLGRNGICSVYQYDQVDQAAKMIREFQGGKAIFIMPPPPIKCAGAPQKIMYLADDVFRKNGIRHKAQIQFATAGKAMFGIPAFSNALDQVVKEKNIEPLFLHKLVGVEPSQKEALFDVTDAEGKVSRKHLKYDLLHIVPPMSAHSFISDSPLAFQEGDQKGWLAVDKYTLQHLKFPNIFGVGDVTGVPNSKTGAAVRKQYPVVVENLLAVMNGKAPSAKYDGYSSCPLVTEIGKVMLAEFGYDGKLMPTFPLDPAVPRTSMWYLKRYLLPPLYWHGMLKGRA